jgi:hypothetical protein
MLVNIPAPWSTWDMEHMEYIYIYMEYDWNLTISWELTTTTAELFA